MKIVEITSTCDTLEQSHAQGGKDESVCLSSSISIASVSTSPSARTKYQNANMYLPHIRDRWRPLERETDCSIMGYGTKVSSTYLSVFSLFVLLNMMILIFMSLTYNLRPDNMRCAFLLCAVLCGECEITIIIKK